MKKKILMLGLLFLFMETFVFSQYLKDVRFFYNAGIKSEQIISKSDSEFSNGLGFSLESYVWINKLSIGMAGVDYYKSNNIVGNSEVACSFWTFYFLPLDWRYNIYTTESGRINLYAGIATAPVLMRTEETKGTDWCWLYAASFGFHFAFAKKSCLQLQIRPYLMSGNQLDKKNGLEIKLSLCGFRAER